jgi:hypothetical protein
MTALQVIGGIAGGVAAIVLLGCLGYFLVRQVFGPNDVMDRDRDGDHFE